VGWVVDGGDRSEGVLQRDPKLASLNDIRASQCAVEDSIHGEPIDLGGASGQKNGRE
jgi:hypothetical protein